jgi:dipeptidyl aminopeptidase/acylaminoacyl peptidase
MIGYTVMTPARFATVISLSSMTRSLRLRAIVHAGVFALLASCSSQESAAPKKAADLSVADNTILSSDGRGFVASPNGKLMAVLNKRTVCITALHKKGSEKCGDETRPAEVVSMRWSPDSKRLVFTERYIDLGQDPGAYVIDAASGKRTTLTNDPAVGVDLFPSFTPDSSTIVYWRFNLASDTATIMTVSAAGGAPSALSTNVSLPARSVAGRITVTEESLLFSRRRATDADAADAGIYQASRDGTNLKQIVRPTESQSAPEVRSVSKALSAAIVADTDQLSGTRVSTNPFSTLDLATGTVTPLTTLKGLVLGATFSPSGEQMLVVAAGEPESTTKANGLFVAVRDGVEGADAVLANLDNFVALNDAGGHSVQWLQDNNVLIANSFAKARAYQLR